MRIAAPQQGNGLRRLSRISLALGVAWACALAWTVQPAGARAAFALTNTALAVSPQSPGISDVVTLTATVTQKNGGAAVTTGNVKFYVDGQQLQVEANGTPVPTGGVAVSSGGVASVTTKLTTAGNHTLTATYLTNSSYGTSTQSQTVTVGAAATKATATITLSGSTSIQSGQTATFTATVTNNGSAAAPTGTVNFYGNGVQLGQATLDGSGNATYADNSFAKGTHDITAQYMGDANNEPAGPSSAVTLTVNAATPTKKSTKVTLSGTNNIQTGQSATFTATVSNGTGTPPTGTVQFKDNGVAFADSATHGVVSLANGVATYTATGFTAITHVITATYSGDADNESSDSGSVSVSVAAPPAAVDTTITASISPNPIPTNGSATLTAHVVQVGSSTTPPVGEVVTFRNKADGSLIGQGTLDANGNATFRKSGWLAGSYTIEATYVGDANFNSSSGNVKVDVRSVARLTITAPSPSLVYGDAVPTPLTPTYSGFASGDDVTSLSSPATCSVSGSPTSPPAVGSYAVTCSGASDPYYTFKYVDGTMTVAKAPLTVAPNDAVMRPGDPVPPLTATISGFVNGETLATSGVTGQADCTTTATSSSPAGAYPITCTVGTLAARNYSFTVAGTGTLTISAIGTKPVQVYDWVGGPMAVGVPVTLKASLFWGLLPLGYRTLTLSVAGYSCTATTNWLGLAQCTVTPLGPLGPTQTSASFAGDPVFAPAEDTRPALLFAWPGGGSFVVGDESASDSASVTFWGSQWSKSNSLSDGKAPNSFKGFAASPSAPGIGDTWTTGPGDSPSPPAAPLPEYMGVIVTSSADKSGSSITGSVVNVVVVRPNAGYDGNPGHSGTGTIVASYAPTHLDVLNHETEQPDGSSAHSGNSDGGGHGSGSSGGGDTTGWFWRRIPHSFAYAQ